MPQDIIDQITQMGQQQHVGKGIEFRQDIGDQGDELDVWDNDDHRNVIEIDDDNEDYIDINNNYNNDYNYAYQEVNDGANGEQEAIRVPINEIQNYIPPEGHAELGEQDDVREIVEANEEPVEEDLAEEPIEEVLVEPGENIDQADNDIERDMNQRYSECTGAYNLQPRQARDYGHLHSTMGHSVFTQLSMKQGLKTFGAQGREAVLSEIKQLHDRGVIQPKNLDTLSPQHKRKALEYLMFPKKKRCGKIKGRGCADGRKQWVYIAKEEASSPTVSIKALMVSCVIDTKEGRDVATADIPGAFMQAEMDEVVYMRLEGVMVDILLELDQKKYGPHVMLQHG
jgi:hypothetical protein